jgi:restriction system protein
MASVALPTWDQFMIPVLKVLADGQVRSRRQLYDEVAAAERLSHEQKAIILDSGQAKYENRIGWAVTYLAKAKAIYRPSRGQQSITDVGRELLEKFPAGLAERDLRTVDGYESPRDRRQARKALAEAAIEVPASDLDPIEQVETGIARINDGVATELIQRLHEREPAFFEQAVVDLVVAMGYGGADAKATRTQLSNDGGIDGIIDQDTLGLNRVYIQAKRYAPDNAVGRPDIQSFVGALHGQQANQGVFITTGRFSTGAVEYAAGVSTRVVLIDGQRLADLMIRYRVGVQAKRTLHIVEVDEDFFE